ncbi:MULTISPECIES: hypothetical protein [unclassified Pseudofrankia]|uniref:hypothetical protein n=1 Tax=unclassified Pseudofrankia TaxID=2994372 RepID=UPI0010420D33|nr:MULTISPECIES: hypothetical protein [unclassified Pseudofrankia]MDT3439640.1 hypothetical protein [Pseudofrankia sp. BMG5.37]
MTGRAGDRSARASASAHGEGWSPSGWTRGPSYTLRLELELADAIAPWQADDWATDDWSG